MNQHLISYMVASIPKRARQLTCAAPVGGGDNFANHEVAGGGITAVNDSE